MLSMALVAWGTFFTEMSNHVEECADMSYCEVKYQEFLKDLGVWLAPGANTEDKAFAHIQKEKLKRVDWGEVAVIAGITVVSTGICIICPPATPWVIAGGVAAGALAEGGLEVYRESRTGNYDWRRILIKTLGGSLKGALAASPLKPLATGIGVGATAAIEEYIYCRFCGETHEQAIRSATINGAIEGVTAGGLKFVCNKIGTSAKTKQILRSNPESVEEINISSLKMTNKVKDHFYDFVGKTKINKETGITLQYKGESSRPYVKSAGTDTILDEIIQAMEPIPDPQGVPNAVRWDVPGTVNGKRGTWELVINKETNTIIHFLFNPKRV